MNGDLSIPLSELGRLAALLLEHVREEAGDRVRLHEDYFWSIPPEQLYDVYDRPKDLTMGQLTETWENLETVLRDPSRVLAYDLVWLSDVLRAVGHAVTSPGRFTAAGLEEVRVSAEYGAGSPVWLVYRDGGCDTPDPKELGLPASLAARLDAWQDAYQDTYDDEYPPDSREMGPAERRAFLEEGRTLAVWLAESLGPRVRVVYWGYGSFAPEVITPGPDAAPSAETGGTQARTVALMGLSSTRAPNCWRSSPNTWKTKRGRSCRTSS